ncbi:carbohydrate binding family 9 domain-containing protein [Occallatibacter savannae]|uniref:carbohydrate binding family 9 domain-containing protein n=1 Tax=Occallatibacter savannae TaxID=1002691 RepID=UPI0013A55733|nr:carbohydrate binding family 9 domain-containing protein [Occallatibacter savannae]
MRSPICSTALIIAVVSFFSSVKVPAQVVNQPAGQPRPVVVPQNPVRMQPTSSVKVPLIDHPLTLNDFSDMAPRADLRDRLAHVEHFSQYEPTDGAPATQNTEVWIGRTTTALYFAFVCFDQHPELIRSHLARRENILKDDYVTVLLDPFQDRLRGVEFEVNAAGVQADAAWTESGQDDFSYDQVWNSDGRVTDKGWMALIALPFRSIRFPAAGRDWGVVLARSLPRNSEADFWPNISRSVSGVLSQEGSLQGIEGVTGSHNVQINPYVLGQNVHVLDQLDPNNPYFSTRHAEATGGGEAKAVWRDSIVFDATFNPDFSDVESDQPQFTVDQRYPVFFPELRPFFLENASYFATPLTLLYTRNIVRPDWGLRVTGKSGRTNIGLLAIDDRQPGHTVPSGDPLRDNKAGFFVGRVSRDLGEGSNAGLIYTDEEFGGGWNRTGGADLTWRADKHWTVLAQLVESSTNQSRPDSVASIFPAGYSAGPAADLQVTRSGHAFNMQNQYQDISRGFKTLTGFIQTANIRSDHLHGDYQWFPKKSVIQSFGLELSQEIAFDHQQNRVYRYTTFDPFWLLPRNIILAPVIGENSDTVGPQNGYALAANRNFTENLGGFVARGQPWSLLSFSINVLRGGNVNYYPIAGSVPFLMHQQTSQARVGINPLRQLTMDNTWLFDRDKSVSDGQLVYETQVFRTKLNYQFTRAWSARVIAEYDTTLANPLETSLERTKRIQAQALLTWLPHPGTVIYVGWNNDLQNYKHTFCTLQHSGTPQCDPNLPILPRGPGYLNDGRQFFIKGSYLFRF